ncbi:hypothetical protein [Endozoicomonas sp. ALC020]|uniref:hypothetical protein n=1 Tax=unclassified Endozoicomonas TaxID=2644528 RepID=UPI003BAF18EE
MALLLLLLSLSVICQAGSLTRRFIVELEQNAGSPKQNFSIKSDWHTLSGNPSDIAHINDYGQSYLPPCKKRNRSPGCGIEKTIIESISWQWLYATNLLIAYEMSVTTKVATRITTPYLSLPSEVLVAVAWFLKNYWNPDTRLFGMIEQQVTSVMTEGDHRFATITAAFGSGENSPQYQSSESSSQPAPKATLPLMSSFISPLNNDYNGGNGGDQQHLHTLGLNCFVHPCYGFCQLHPLSGSSEPAEWPLNTLKSSCPHLATGHCSGCMGHFDPAKAMESRQNPLFRTFNDFSDIQFPFDSDPQFDDIDGHFADLIQNAIDATESLDDDVQMLGYLSSIADDLTATNGSLDLQRLLGEHELAFTLNSSETQQTTFKSSQLDQSQAHLSLTGALQAKADSGQKICELTVVLKGGEQQPCGKVFKNAISLSSHKRRCHTGPKVCDLTVMREDGQQGPCGMVYKNAGSLVNHKRTFHTGQKTCDQIEVGEDGQQRRCGKICKNAGALSDHKSKYHKGQKTCEVIVFGEDGQQRPCGKLFMNTNCLEYHKREEHSGERTCDVVVVAEDGQQRSCGRLFTNTKKLKYHKRQEHSRKRACKVVVVGEEGQLRPCSNHCKNAVAVSKHKRSYHSGQQTCEVLVVGEDGRQRPCGKLCNNARALVNHKRGKHSGQKTCEIIMFEEDDGQRRCGKVCKSAGALSDHKRNYHSGQVCEVIVFGEDGQLRPCGTFCKNHRALIYHKSKCHSEQRICALILVGEDGQQRLCGQLSKNAKALSIHKSTCHSGEKICDSTVTGEDGRQQSCRKVFKSAIALTSHKNKCHTGQKSCDVTVVCADGQQQPCGKVYKNAQSLWSHKRSAHKKQQDPNPGVIEDGQQRASVIVCKKPQDLSDHNRRDRKRKPADLDEDGELIPAADKVNKCDYQEKLTD